MPAILHDAFSDNDPTKDEGGESIGEVLEAAIDALKRRLFLTAEWDEMTQAN